MSAELVPFPRREPQSNDNEQVSHLVCHGCKMHAFYAVVVEDALIFECIQCHVDLTAGVMAYVEGYRGEWA